MISRFKAMRCGSAPGLLQARSLRDLTNWSIRGDFDESLALRARALRKATSPYKDEVWFRKSLEESLLLVICPQKVVLNLYLSEALLFALPRAHRRR